MKNINGHILTCSLGRYEYSTRNLLRAIKVFSEGGVKNKYIRLAPRNVNKYKIWVTMFEYFLEQNKIYLELYRNGDLESQTPTWGERAHYLADKGIWGNTKLGKDGKRKQERYSEKTCRKVMAAGKAGELGNFPNVPSLEGSRSYNSIGE